MLDLARGLTLRGVSTYLVLTRAEGVYRKLLSNQVKMVDLGAWRSATALPSLLHHLRMEKPNILISTLGVANFNALIAKKY